MKLKIDDLYPLQEKLDERIFTMHGVDRPSTRSDRTLALLVEIGEMVNETKCFKYWSVKPASPKPVILEEYGDGVHFLLSLGLDLNDDHAEISSLGHQGSLSELTLETYAAVVELRKHFSLDNYRNAFGAFLDVAEKLDFGAADIREYYFRKNLINHQRQDENY